MDKCFCHLNGYAVKDAQARRDIEELKDKVAKPITEIVEKNKGESISLWVGTKEELAAETESLDNTQVILTDDTTAEELTERVALTEGRISKLETESIKTTDNLVLKNNAKITFLGAKEQSDCGLTAILQTSDKCFIFDAGRDNTCKYLKSFISDKGISRVNGFIISHFHEDHIGGVHATGLLELIETFPNVFSSCTFYLPHQADTWTDEEWKKVSSSNNLTYKTFLNDIIINIPRSCNVVYPDYDGYTLSLDDNTKIKFYNVNKSHFEEYFNNHIASSNVETTYSSYNNFSMVSIIEHHNNKIVITGDIEYLAEKNIAKYLTNADVLQIEHHGENYYSHPDYISNINAKIGVIPTYNHISENLLFRPTATQIINTGGKVYYTSGVGNVEIKSTERDVFIDNDITPIEVNNTANYSLTYGNKIEPGTDFDNLVLEGVYSIANNGVLQTMSNFPAQFNGGCKIIVEKLTENTSSLKQTVISANSHRLALAVRSRFWIEGTGYVWSNWKYINSSEIEQFNGGFFEKIGDGRFKCVFKKSFTVTENNPAGQSYYSESLSVDLPITVTSAFVNGNAERLISVANGELGSNKKSIYFRLLRPEPFESNVSYYVTLSVEGYWA